MLRIIPTTAFVIAMIATPALAATVDTINAPVSLNKGKGYAPVARKATVKVGDNVMAGPGGRATVTFDNGCVVTVEPGSVYNVPAGNPCDSAASPGGTAIVVGAVATVGIVGIVSLNGKNSSKPASP